MPEAAATAHPRLDCIHGARTVLECGRRPAVQSGHTEGQMHTEYLPKLLPTMIDEGQGPGVQFRTDGELVPALTMELDGSMPVYFEHHILLWKTPSLEIGMHPMKGAFKRAVAGMPIFMTEARGAGQIAFSRDGVGHVFHLQLAPGQTVEVREHQFLAATANIDYSFRRLKGVGNMLFGGTGIFIDTFSGGQGGGTLWLHGYGNVFEKVLGPGEVFDVEPGGWVYKDPGVNMEIKLVGLRMGILGGSGNLIFNRFTGPGRIGIQSMYLHMPTED
jgi:uncharacterized protein (AIM24 family)